MIATTRRVVILIMTRRFSALICFLPVLDDAVGCFRQPLFVFSQFFQDSV
jgi:hypothetical protein